MFMSLWACLQSSRVTKVREVPFLLGKLKIINRVREMLSQLTAGRKGHAVFTAVVIIRHATLLHTRKQSVAWRLCEGDLIVSYLLSLSLAWQNKRDSGVQTPCHVHADYQARPWDSRSKIQSCLTKCSLKKPAPRLWLINNQSNGRYHYICSHLNFLSRKWRNNVRKLPSSVNVKRSLSYSFWCSKDNNTHRTAWENHKLSG